MILTPWPMGHKISETRVNPIMVWCRVSHCPICGQPNEWCLLINCLRKLFTDLIYVRRLIYTNLENSLTSKSCCMFPSLSHLTCPCANPMQRNAIQCNPIQSNAMQSNVIQCNAPMSRKTSTKCKNRPHP